MLEDDLSQFISNIYKYLVNQDRTSGLLIKKHSGNLKTHGDFSFVNTQKSWQAFLSCDEKAESNDSFLNYLKKTTEDLVIVSQTWPIPISKCIKIKDRVHIFIARSPAISIGLTHAVFNNQYLISILTSENKKMCVKVDVNCPNDNVTSLRVKCFANVVRNLCDINIIEANLTVTSKSSNDFNKNLLYVGPVLNGKNSFKENTISGKEFIRIRQDELTLIAQHKYGVRVSVDEKWKEFIVHLGESAAAFELLQTKPSSPVKILFDSSGGSSKGAAFILYNCARLETLVRTFSEKVAEGSYPPLPDLQHIDLSLLNDEDEWCLIFEYIMGLPALGKSSVELKGGRYEFRPHLICNYLSSMVKLFSQYYRRVRILTEPRKHLLPVIHARIFMLKILNDTLKTCLRILNIKSVTQM